MVRLLLGPLQRPEEACQLAQHSGDESALCQAAEYLLGSGQHEVRSGAGSVQTDTSVTA